MNYKLEILQQEIDETLQDLSPHDDIFDILYDAREAIQKELNKEANEPAE